MVPVSWRWLSGDYLEPLVERTPERRYNVCRPVPRHVGAEPAVQVTKRMVSAPRQPGLSHISRQSDAHIGAAVPTAAAENSTVGRATISYIYWSIDDLEKKVYDHGFRPALWKFQEHPPLATTGVGSVHPRANYARCLAFREHYDRHWRTWSPLSRSNRSVRYGAVESGHL